MDSILLRKGKIIDVINRRIYWGDIFIKNGIISQLKPDEVIDKEINLKGAYVSPGLIDGHLHIESSMLTPIEFSKKAIIYGTTSIFVDPHEIANVMGKKGVELFLDQARYLPLRMHVGIPSCVPATHMETSGGVITTSDIKELISRDKVYGLAEMMNFPGIINDIGEAREKVQIAIEAGKIVDGHAPGVTGEDLIKYISNGKKDGIVRIGSDHECTTPDEAIEKSSKGMFIMLRYGSSSKDLENILPEICKRKINLDNFGLVSDDLNFMDLARRGHINHLIGIAAKIIKKNKRCWYKTAIIEAIRMATINNAKYFNQNTGAISIGKKADLIVFESLKDISPDMVISEGKIVVQGHKYIGPEIEYDYSGYEHPISIPKNISEKLVITSKKEKEKVRIIELEKNSLITKEVIQEMEVRQGVIYPRPEENISKISVIERHNSTGNAFTALVKNTGLKTGAIASTVAHDSHNLIVVSNSASSSIRIIEKVKHIGGGLVAVNGDKEAHLRLDLAGLMSTKPISEVISEYKILEKMLNSMGFTDDPFPRISFIALPVIPKLKITDKGLVDVEKFDFVNLFV